MRRSEIVIAAVLCLAAVPTLAARPAEPTALRSDEAEIRAALERWVEAANRQDWKAALDIWAPDMIGWFPGQPDDTYALEKANENRPKYEHSSHFELTINEVMVSGDLAVARLTWKMSSADPARPGSLTFRSFEVWRRQPGGAWKISRWISAPQPEVSTSTRN